MAAREAFVHILTTLQEATADIINVNVSGTVASVLAVYELMRARSYGKIVSSFCFDQDVLIQTLFL